MIFILLIMDFATPSWVLGPWFYVVNAFCIIGIAVSLYDTFKD